MSTYTAPTFNLTCNLWSQEVPQLSANWPWVVPTRTPEYAGVCQLYLQQRAGGFNFSLPYYQGSQLNSFVGARIDLRLPAGTLVRYPVPNEIHGLGMLDVVEVPAGSGRLYVVVFAIAVHVGFPNEYMMAMLIPYINIGTPEEANWRVMETWKGRAGMS